MQRYIVALQEWLNLWRLTIAAHKCSYTIYLGKLPDLIQDQTLKLTLYGERIPLDHNPKYLGITLDRNLSFGPHVDNIRRKCLRLLDILKCLSYKNWSANIDQQLTVYKTLIRSCMEYAPPLSLISTSNISRLQGVQYQALRIIYKAPLKSSSTDLHNKAKISTVNIRLNYLSKKYLTKAIYTNNELINILIVNRNSTQDPSPPTLLDIMGFAGSGASVTPQKGLAVQG